MDYLGGPATEYLCRVSRKKARLCKAITSRNCNSAARRHDGRRYHDETVARFHTSLPLPQAGLEEPLAEMMPAKWIMRNR